jgi:hypothetical protein
MNNNKEDVNSNGSNFNCQPFIGGQLREKTLETIGKIDNTKNFNILKPV